MSKLVLKGPAPPDVQRDIVADYQHGVSGHGYGSLAAKYHRSQDTIKSIVSRAKNNDGDPVTPRGHRKRKLSEAEEIKVHEYLDTHPSATNKDLAAKVKHKVSTSTISRTLARAKPAFSKHKYSDQEPEEKTDEWQDQMRDFINKVLGRIPLYRRIYGDETPVYANEAPKVGRGRKGKKLLRPRKRYAKKYTLHVYATSSEVIYWELADVNADDDEIVRVVGEFAHVLEDGQVLLWDRLGGSGRSKNPMKQHFNPEAIKMITDMGAKVAHLPPKGKYLDPMELLFNDLKEHYIRAKFHVDGTDMTKAELTKIIRKYMNDVAPDKLPGFFRARANGRDAKRMKLF